MLSLPKSNYEIIALAKRLNPLVDAEVGLVVTHHTEDARHGGWDEDEFEFCGVSNGKTKTPKGWLVFQWKGRGRGICAEGVGAPGLNGGVLDAIGAWPLEHYRWYKPDHTFDPTYLALPPEKCWGFRPIDNSEGSSDEEEEEQEEEPSPKKLRKD